MTFFPAHNYLDPVQQNILASAAVLLQTDKPDCFDYNKLASLAGTNRQLVVAAFPFPELLTLGIKVNGFRLDNFGWEPDSELLAHFPAHPVVEAYQIMLDCSLSTRGGTTQNFLTSERLSDA